MANNYQIKPQEQFRLARGEQRLLLVIGDSLLPVWHWVSRSYFGRREIPGSALPLNFALPHSDLVLLFAALLDHLIGRFL